MKIEKISSTQVKFLLNQSDLKERNIKLSELAYGSEKTQALFREMMAQAVDTCGFTVENTPLMIEAVPVTGDSIMIIVSKVNQDSEVVSKFNLTPPTKDERKYVKTPINDELSPIPIDDSSLSIYSFDTLDISSDACRPIVNNYDGISQLYKYEGNYYLVVQNDSIINMDTDTFDNILTEYGKKHISTVVSKAFLMEHSEIIIKSNAVSVLASL